MAIIGTPRNQLQCQLFRYFKFTLLTLCGLLSIKILIKLFFSNSFFFPKTYSKNFMGCQRLSPDISCSQSPSKIGPLPWSYQTVLTGCVVRQNREEPLVISIGSSSPISSPSAPVRRQRNRSPTPPTLSQLDQVRRRLMF